MLLLRSWLILITSYFFKIFKHAYKIYFCEFVYFETEVVFFKLSYNLKNVFTLNKHLFNIHSYLFIWPTSKCQIEIISCCLFSCSREVCDCFILIEIVITLDVLYFIFIFHFVFSNSALTNRSYNMCDVILMYFSSTQNTIQMMRKPFRT